MPVYEPLIPGPAGTAGQPGVAGLPGDDGEEGQPGSPGPAGTAGAAGSTGAAGPSGPAIFLVGEDGEAGEAGPPGVPGAAGAAGGAGSPGATGPSGPAIFLVGEDGEEGAAGPPGVAGVAGAAGTTGTQGPMGPAVFLEADFIEGEMGPPGPQGAAGTGGGFSATPTEQTLGADQIGSATFTITDAAVLAASDIMAWLTAEPPAVITDAFPFRSFTSATPAGSQVSVTLNLPAGTAQNDILIAVVNGLNGVAYDTFIQPAGWTLLGFRRFTDTTATTFSICGVWQKIAGANEPASYTWSSVSAFIWAASMLAYQGGSAVPAPSVLLISPGDDQKTTTQNYGPLIGNNTDKLVVAYASRATTTGGWSAGPAGLTDRTGNIVNANNADVRVWDFLWSSNGVSESGSATHNESTEYVSFALRFQVNHLDGDEADMEPMDVQAEAIAGGSFSLVADVRDGPTDGRYVFAYAIG